MQLYCYSSIPIATDEMVISLDGTTVKLTVWDGNPLFAPIIVLKEAFTISVAVTLVIITASGIATPSAYSWIVTGWAAGVSAVVKAISKLTS